jgi:hypothetical protein
VLAAFLPGKPELDTSNHAERAMADFELLNEPTAVKRQGWETPRITHISSATEAEAGINNGPEILILLS